MSNDHDAVVEVLETLSPEGKELLRKVLRIERDNIHIKAADPTDEIYKIVQGLMK